MCASVSGCVGRDVEENYAVILQGGMVTENKFPNLENQGVSVCPHDLEKDKGLPEGVDKILGSSSSCFEGGVWGWHGKRETRYFLVLSLVELLDFKQCI